MEPSELGRAVAAAISTASELDLTANAAVVLHNSNRVALRLLPCDVLARVARSEHAAAPLEVEIAIRLAELETPVAALQPRVGGRVYERDGFLITLWTYYDPVSPRMRHQRTTRVPWSGCIAGLRQVDVVTPHFTDRVAEAQQLVARHEYTPALADADRELVRNTLRSLTKAIARRGAAEQVLHGEPHPGNVLNTKSGPLFIDFETVCRGPVEFDLAHVPEEVSDRYPDSDQHCSANAVGWSSRWSRRGALTKRPAAERPPRRATNSSTPFGRVRRTRR